MSRLFDVYTGGKYLPVYVYCKGFYRVPDEYKYMLKELDNIHGRRDFYSMIQSFKKINYDPNILGRFEIRSFNADAF